ncbi:MAG: PEP-CTERM sorting domain-containing protein [Acidobacteriota bacterium]
MRTHFFRPIATILSLLLLVAVPAQASPIKFVDVVNVMGDLQNGGQLQRLRLRASAQDPSTSSNTTTSQSSTATTAPALEGDAQTSTSSLAGADTATPPLTSGTEVAPQQQGDVQVFEQDNVDGTICDCGEIPSVGGGFPKWPFLALIPLICVTGVCSHHHKDCVECIPPPPTPTPPVPEPASLLLFGSGIVALSAGARRRYAKMRANKQAATMTEV